MLDKALLPWFCLWLVVFVEYSIFRIYNYLVPIKKIMLCCWNLDLKWRCQFVYVVTENSVLGGHRAVVLKWLKSRRKSWNSDGLYDLFSFGVFWNCLCVCRQAKKKRRIVLGLREVTKHLRLKKIKCVIISPNLERIQSKGSLLQIRTAVFWVWPYYFYFVKHKLSFSGKKWVLGKYVLLVQF